MKNVLFSVFSLTLLGRLSNSIRLKYSIFWQHESTFDVNGNLWTYFTQNKHEKCNEKLSRDESTWKMDECISEKCANFNDKWYVIRYVRTLLSSLERTVSGALLQSSIFYFTRNYIFELFSGPWIISNIYSEKSAKTCVIFCAERYFRFSVFQF